MFPIIPILAWTGGIAAGAQVAGGVVRGMGELVRGRPGAALLEVADGCVAPLRTACQEVSRLGHDVYMAVLGPWQSQPQPLTEPEIRLQEVPAPPPQRSRRRRDKSAETKSALLNGVAEVPAEC
jgi:hypothetical protein